MSDTGTSETGVGSTRSGAAEPARASDGRSVTGWRSSPWWSMVVFALPVYVVSRLCVLVGAGVIASELRVDTNLANEAGSLVGDPHARVGSGSAIRPIVDILTSWDGLWYMAIARDGYPTSIPPDVTYHVDEARAAFFPLFPLLTRAVDLVLPGGDTAAVLFLNGLLGFVAVVGAGMLGRKLYGVSAGRLSAVFMAFFPGSFVLSFAYSEALFVVIALACLWFLLDEEWTAAGVMAALGTATRPNGVALVAACAVAALIAIRRDRDWRSLVAVALAPVGFVSFQLWLGQHTGEAGAWFRVQREAWDEGASFGLTALRNTAEAVVQPLTSPTDTITAISVVTTVALIVMAHRSKLPLVPSVYSWTIIAMMVLPATVTARPRFIYAAFPLLIGAAAWFDERRDRDELLLPLLLVACGAGLAALTGLYGGFGAIP